MIYVKDLPGMAAFYEEVLGLKVVEETRAEGWVEFEAGAVRLGLHAIPAEIAEEIEITVPPVARVETPLKFIFEVEDIGVLAARGLIVIEQPWGGCDGVDPEGNIFHLFVVKR